MSKSQQHGGKREGAGRPKGSLNRRSIAVIEAVAEKYPDWTPLMHLATVANNEELPVDVRVDAAKAAAPFVHAKAKAAVLDQEELIALERRIARVRLEEASKAVKDNPMLAGLADRLFRAAGREEDAPFIAPIPAAAPVQSEPASQPAPVAPAGPGNVDHQRATSEQPASEQEAPPHVDDWSEPAQPPAPRYVPILPAWPDEGGAVETDYDPLA